MPLPRRSGHSPQCHFALAALFVLVNTLIKPALRVKGDSGSSFRRGSRF